MPKHDLPTWDDLARKVADLERYQDQPHLRAKYDEDAEFVVQLALVLQTGEVEPKHIQLRSKLGPAWNLILGIAEELYTSAVHQRSGISQNLVAVEDFYNERIRLLGEDIAKVKNRLKNIQDLEDNIL